MDKTFYLKNEYDVDKIIDDIEEFSNIFTISFTFYIPPKIEKENIYKKNFFINSINFAKSVMPLSTYIIYCDLTIKTEIDEGADFSEQLEASIFCYNPKTNLYEKAHKNFSFTNHMTKCALVAKLNKKTNNI